jgi:hypothetical protein
MLRLSANAPAVLRVGFEIGGQSTPPRAQASNTKFSYDRRPDWRHGERQQWHSDSARL